MYTMQKYTLIYYSYILFFALHTLFFKSLRGATFGIIYAYRRVCNATKSST